MDNKWIVDVKGEANGSSFEISVLRENNTHGRESFGWFGVDKRLISSSGGPCRNCVTESVWDMLIHVAHIEAAMLNAGL